MLNGTNIYKDTLWRGHLKEGASTTFSKHSDCEVFLLEKVKKARKFKPVTAKISCKKFTMTEIACFLFESYCSQGLLHISAVSIRNSINNPLRFRALN